LRSFKKMLLGAVTTMVLAAGVAVSPASATVPSKGFDTIEANVPYLAWRGEHIRLGACDAGVSLAGGTVSWALEDWSGDPANGSVPVPQEMFGQRHTTNGCVYTDYVSQKAGVAFIKLVVSGANGVNVFEKQFMAAWMDLGTPTVTGGGTVDPGSLSRVCSDPIYAACDQAKDPRHRIKVVVKGTIPLKANFNEWEAQINALGLSLVTPGQLTLPDDWAAWAAVAARSWNDFLQSDWITNWDIHDDLTTVEGHVITGGAQCDPASETNLAGTTDAVDNCDRRAVFGGPKGSFSTVFGLLSNTNSVGPFDPLYPTSTLLSNGTVDAGDAPMPAAQIDAKIVENTGAPTDISGVGFLFPSFKTQVYSRDGFGTVKAHNFDAPFYYQYIPATARPTSASPPYGSPQASGIDGSGDPDGFNGFWWRGGPTPYQNWEFAFSTSYHPNALSHCLQSQDPTTLATTYRPLPSGISAVAVYTDEHGEANVNFVPGLGYYFDNVGALKAQGGCDLGLVRTLGTSHITVQARYPYQPVTAADPLGAPVDFVVRNLFQKVLGDFAKGPGSNNHRVRVVLAHAQEIDGSPIVGEFVCWSQQGAGSILPFPQGPNGEIHQGANAEGPLVATIDQAQSVRGTFFDVGGRRLCTTTDANGNTAVEVLNSESTIVDVMAQFMHEVIFRDIPVNFGGTPTGIPGGSLGQDVVSGSQIPTPTQIRTSLAANPVVGPVVIAGQTLKTKVIKSHKVAKVLHKIRFARVLIPFHGKRSLQVRVNGKAGLVGLRITIRFGGKNHVYIRHIPANRKISIKDLPLPAKVVKVTVKLIGG
jgi:hypothetical protein